MFSQTNHFLSEEDKKAVIDLLKQVAAKLNFPANLPEASNNRQGMGQASSGYVQNAMDAAKAYPTVPSGDIDTAVMETKYAACRDLDDVLKVLMPITFQTLNLRRLHGQDLMVASNSIKGSFAIAAKNKAELKSTADQLKQRYARAKKDEAAAKREQKNAQNGLTASNGNLSSGSSTGNLG